MSRDGSKTDIALTFSSKRGQWAFTLDSPREKNSGNVSCHRLDNASVGGASVVVVAKLAPACSPPARVASKPGSRRRARSCGSARSVPRVDRASCRARVVLVSARVVVSSPVDRPPGGSVLANDVARARRRSAMLAKRDLFALLLSAFAVYYGTRSESFVTFDRAWYLPLDPGGNAPRYDDPATRHGVDNHPPPPLFVDLNGDGEYEIIAASASAPEIRVFAQPANNGGAPLRPRGSRATDDVFAGDAARWEDSSSSSSASSASSFGAARTIAVASLIPENVRVSAGRRAIALAAGHLVPAGDSASSRSARKAVVVVVTEGWHVLCFDHNLRLMWERTLQESFPRHARVREVAVMVSDASMFEGDEGAVIVGGRVELGDVADAADEDPLSEELSDERMLGRHRGGARASREEMARDDVTGSSTRLGAGVDASRHFDYHAFEGSTGAPVGGTRVAISTAPPPPSRNSSSRSTITASTPPRSRGITTARWRAENSARAWWRRRCRTSGASARIRDSFPPGSADIEHPEARERHARGAVPPPHPREGANTPPTPSRAPSPPSRTPSAAAE